MNQEKIQNLSLAITEELRVAMAQHKTRQVTIAEALGTSQGSVSEKLNRIYPITISEFVAWCYAMGEEPSDLLRRAEHSIRARHLQAVADPVENVTPAHKDDFDLAAMDMDRAPGTTIAEE